MVYVTDCSLCMHRRKEKANGYLPTCDAFPDGKPTDFDYGSVRERGECSNGIGFEPNDLCKRIEARRKGTDKHSQH